MCHLIKQNSASDLKEVESYLFHSRSETQVSMNHKIMFRPSSVSSIWVLF